MLFVLIWFALAINWFIGVFARLTGNQIAGHTCPSSPDTLLVFCHNSANSGVKSKIKVF
jgi:hypothetical protein